MKCFSLYILWPFAAFAKGSYFTMEYYIIQYLHILCEVNIFHEDNKFCGFVKHMLHIEEVIAQEFAGRFPA